LWAGRADVAIECFEKSLRLNPLRKAPATYSIGLDYFFARSPESGSYARGLAARNAHWAPCLRFLASCLAHPGRLKEAQEMVKRVHAITPIVIRDPECRTPANTRGSRTRRKRAGDLIAGYFRSMVELCRLVATIAR
jgi:tetratricopeptide (TPR) repeat protein